MAEYEEISMNSKETQSLRLLRVGERVRHALSDILARGDVHDKILATHIVSVTKVRMSPDLKHAIVFVKPLLGGNEEEVLAALKRNVRYLRGQVSRKVNSKYSTTLKFLLDESFDQGRKIDMLLRSPQVAQDLTDDE